MQLDGVGRSPERGVMSPPAVWQPALRILADLDPDGDELKLAAGPLAKIRDGQIPTGCTRPEPDRE